MDEAGGEADVGEVEEAEEDILDAGGEAVVDADRDESKDEAEKAEEDISAADCSSAARQAPKDVGELLEDSLEVLDWF